jgi:Activator of Hsp90 ATPase homolog 1-like protein
MQLTNESDAFSFTAILSLDPHENSTKYKATVIHGDGGSCKRHNDMGFQDGWGKALDQLVAHMKNI